MNNLRKRRKPDPHEQKEAMETHAVINSTPFLYVKSEEDLNKIYGHNTPSETLELSPAMTFFNREREISAYWIMSYLKDHGDTWMPFEEEKLQKYYEKKLKRKEDFWFNRLDLGENSLILRQSGMLYVSSHFILKANLNGLEPSSSVRT